MHDGRLKSHLNYIAVLSDIPGTHVFIPYVAEDKPATDAVHEALSLSQVFTQFATAMVLLTGCCCCCLRCMKK